MIEKFVNRGELRGGKVPYNGRPVCEREINYGALCHHVEIFDGRGCKEVDHLQPFGCRPKIADTHVEQTPLHVSRARRPCATVLLA